MNKGTKIAIVGVALLVPIVAIASKAKNAFNKITFCITGFAILGFTAGGLKVRFRSEFVNDTGQTFTVNNMLSKLLYKEGTTSVFSEFARAASIASVTFINAVPQTIDSIFTIDIMQIPKLFKSNTFRISSYFTLLGFEQALNFDMSITDLKAEVLTRVSNASWVPSFIKNLITGKQPISGYNAPYFQVTDLQPSQYEIVSLVKYISP